MKSLLFVAAVTGTLIPLNQLSGAAGTGTMKNTCKIDFPNMHGSDCLTPETSCPINFSTTDVSADLNKECGMLIKFVSKLNPSLVSYGTVVETDYSSASSPLAVVVEWQHHAITCPYAKDRTCYLDDSEGAVKIVDWDTAFLNAFEISSSIDAYDITDGDDSVGGGDDTVGGGDDTVGGGDTVGDDYELEELELHELSGAADKGTMHNTCKIDFPNMHGRDCLTPETSCPINFSTNDATQVQKECGNLLKFVSKLDPSLVSYGTVVESDMSAAHAPNSVVVEWPQHAMTCPYAKSRTCYLDDTEGGVKIEDWDSAFLNAFNIYTEIDVYRVHVNDGEAPEPDVTEPEVTEPAPEVTEPEITEPEFVGPLAIDFLCGSSHGGIEDTCGNDFNMDGRDGMTIETALPIIVNVASNWEDNCGKILKFESKSHPGLFSFGEVINTGKASEGSPHTIIVDWVQHAMTCPLAKDSVCVAEGTEGAVAVVDWDTAFINAFDVSTSVDVFEVIVAQ